MIVGLDLCDDFSQLSVYNSAAMQPESLSITKDPAKFRIPTALAMNRHSGEWFFGEDAITRYKDEGCLFVDHIISRGIRNEALEQTFARFSPAGLIERFLRLIFGGLKMKTGEEILKVVCTLEVKDEKLVENVRAAFLNMGIGDDRLTIQTHMESFMYYVVSQNREIFVNDVALFEFTKEGLKYYRLSFGKKQMPLVVSTDFMDLADTISFDQIKSGDIDRLVYSFRNVVKGAFTGRFISSVFATGVGFENNWADDVFREMSSGRKVFRGQNLYTKGACYAARLFALGQGDEFRYLSEDVVKSDIFLKVSRHDGDGQIQLARAGDSWKDIFSENTIILQDTNELNLVIRNTMRNEMYTETMKLEGIFIGEDRVTRLNVRTCFADKSTAVITIRDMGFGDFFETNFRIWEKLVNTGN